MKVVIVGGVAGGATAAARIRRLDEQAEIIVFERSGYISYANCGLPYYIGDVITDADDLKKSYCRIRARKAGLCDMSERPSQLHCLPDSGWVRV